MSSPPSNNPFLDDEEGGTSSWGDFMEKEMNSAPVSNDPMGIPIGKSSPLVTEEPERVQEPEDNDGFQTTGKKSSGYPPRKGPSKGYPSRPKKVFTKVEFKDSSIPTKAPFVVYLGNLPYTMAKSDVFAMFEKFDTVGISIPSGQNGLKGFGYVELKTREDMIECLNMQGSPLGRGYKARQMKTDIAESETAQRMHEKHTSKESQLAHEAETSDSWSRGKKVEKKDKKFFSGRGRGKKWGDRGRGGFRGRGRGGRGGRGRGRGGFRGRGRGGRGAPRRDRKLENEFAKMMSGKKQNTKKSNTSVGSAHGNAFDALD